MPRSLQAGSLTTTFTASQAPADDSEHTKLRELTSTVFHIAARALAAQALSIFGDHNDVMSARSTGFGMLSSNSVQEVMDMALIAQAATLEARLPFMHFFDGFRTSHEVAKVEQLSAADIRAMIDENLVFAHRSRALSPDRPVIRGTAQNPDVYFQAREACNPYYLAAPTIVQNAMDKFARSPGVSITSSTTLARDANALYYMGLAPKWPRDREAMLAAGEKVGLSKSPVPALLHRSLRGRHPEASQIRRPSSTAKEPGATGEPSATSSPPSPKWALPGDSAGATDVDGIHPAMVRGLRRTPSTPQNHFTIGIKDDVTHTSLITSRLLHRGLAPFASVLRLGADGSRRQQNSIKIIGEETDYAQGYFVYDSRSRPITLRALATNRSAPATHHQGEFRGMPPVLFLERIDMLKLAEPGATSQQSFDADWV